MDMKETPKQYGNMHNKQATFLASISIYNFIYACYNREKEETWQENGRYKKD